MQEWYKHYSSELPRLSDQERQIVEYLTGRIPLLLRVLIGIKKFNEEEFSRFPDLQKVDVDISNFFRARINALKEDEKDEYVLCPPVLYFSSMFLQLLRHHGSISSTISCRTGFEGLRFAVLLRWRRWNWTLHLWRRLRIHDDST
jgi:hypothetical protein